jgi:hypothetical protein
MIDIRISPSEVVTAKKAIREMVQRHNRYAFWNTIELRCPQTGWFESLYDHIQVIDHERTAEDDDDWTFFLRVEFDGVEYIANSIEAYFGERNVAFL